MRSYKNCGRSVKHFYGVTIRPGEVGTVPGWVVDDDMVLVDSPESAFTSTEKPSCSNAGRKSRRNNRRGGGHQTKPLIPKPQSDDEAEGAQGDAAEAADIEPVEAEAASKEEDAISSEDKPQDE